MSNHPRRHMNMRTSAPNETHVVPRGLTHGYSNLPDGPRPFVVIHADDETGRRVEWVIFTDDALLLAAGLCGEIEGALDCPDYIEAKERFQP